MAFFVENVDKQPREKSVDELVSNAAVRGEAEGMKRGGPAYIDDDVAYFLGIFWCFFVVLYLSVHWQWINCLG